MWLATVAVLVAAAAGLAAARPSAAATLDQLSDRTHKANLVKALGYSPKLVFVGGSRSMRFDPAYGKRLTGLRGFNAAFINGHPEDVWAFTHHLIRRAPRTKLRLVWGIPLGGLFTDRRFDKALVSDPRLNRWFPLSLRQKMRGGESHPWSNVTFRRDGTDVYDNYDRKLKAGRTLSESLDIFIAAALKRHSDDDTIGDGTTRARAYFEKELTWLSQQGCAPLLLIMPLHPRVIAAIRDEHWDNRRQSMHDYLTNLQQTVHFTWLDFTFISSFGGDPAAFYDGDHMKASNMRRLLKAAVKQAPWAFGLAAAPWDPPPYGLTFPQ